MSHTACRAHSLHPTPCFKPPTHSGITPNNHVMAHHTHHYCIILAGGAGRRLWPTSTETLPKQFLDFFGCGRTLLQQTYDRFVKIVPREHIIVSTFADYVPLVEQQLPDLPQANILPEPVQLNTAPAVVWATWHVFMKDREGIVVVSPADQLIQNEEKFQAHILRGMDYAASHEEFLAMGVRPTMPNTSYGYIQMGEEAGPQGTYRVQSFSEKPEADYASMFMQSGEFLWNTGIFIWSAMTMGLMLMHLDGDPYAAARTISEHDLSASEEATYVKNYFPSELPRSMDLLILEKCHNVAVLECDFGWADIGCWGGLRDNLPHDADGNAITGRGKVLLNASQNNLISLPEGYTAIVNGLDRYVVALNGKTLLISPHHDAEALRRLINEAMVNL